MCLHTFITSIVSTFVPHLNKIRSHCICSSFLENAIGSTYYTWTVQECLLSNCTAGLHWEYVRGKIRWSQVIFILIVVKSIGFNRVISLQSMVKIIIFEAIRRVLLLFMSFLMVCKILYHALLHFKSCALWTLYHCPDLFFLLAFSHAANHVIKIYTPITF